MKATKPNFAKSKTAVIAITTGLAMLAVLALQTFIWATDTYAIPAAHKGIVAIAKMIKAKQPETESVATKELSPATELTPQSNPTPQPIPGTDWFDEVTETFTRVADEIDPPSDLTPEQQKGLSELMASHELWQDPEPASKPKAKAKRAPKSKGIATLIITDADPATHPFA